MNGKEREDFSKEGLKATSDASLVLDHKTTLSIMDSSKSQVTLLESKLWVTFLLFLTCAA